MGDSLQSILSNTWAQMSTGTHIGAFLLLGLWLYSRHLDKKANPPRYYPGTRIKIED